MNDFTADWLALREPADKAARSIELTGLVAERLTGLEIVRVLDLGTGTGANLRFLAEQLAGAQQWTLVDRDAALLRQVAQRVSSWGASRGYVVSGNAAGFGLRGPTFDCRVETRAADLSKSDDQSLFQGKALVTASALLDLVSTRWMEMLAARCREAGAVVLFALTYDGRIIHEPAEPEDRIVRDLVNRHQRTAKGFGRASGPEAADVATRVFRAAGYEVHRKVSDWQLGPAQGVLQRQLLEGWARAATAIDPIQELAIDDWKTRRLDHITAGLSFVTVGHIDLAGWLVSDPAAIGSGA
jgi:SAM-dependent methyltransferase